MPRRQSNKDQTKRFSRKILIGISVIVCVLLIFGELMIGNIAYYLKWQQCGQQPVVVTHTMPLGLGYVPPVYTVYLHPSFLDAKFPVISILGSPAVYCSLDEARQKYGIDLQIQN